MQVYLVINKVNGKIYIGKDESSRSSYFGSGKLIRRAIQLYGKSNFVKYVLEETTERKILSKKEIYWIAFFNSTNRNVGYNISNGGDGGDTISNHPNRELICEKISNSMKGRIFTEEHLNNLKKNHPRLTMEEKNIDKETWLINIRKSHAKRKGKTLEQIVGTEKARTIKKHLRIKRAERSEAFNMRVGKYSKDGKLLHTYSSQKEASITEGIRQADISNCITGRQLTVKGYVWKKL